MDMEAIKQRFFKSLSYRQNASFYRSDIQSQIKLRNPDVLDQLIDELVNEGKLSVHYTELNNPIYKPARPKELNVHLMKLSNYSPPRKESERHISSWIYPLIKEKSNG